MKIYTKHGDQGQTGLYGGDRVAKDHLRIRAYGTLDELNAWVGLVLSALSGQKAKSKTALKSVTTALSRIQNELFTLGSELATPRGQTLKIQLLGEAETASLEREIDAWDKKLPKLKSFILPGGSELASLLHCARTVSRRAEREITTLHRGEPLRPEILVYINRLSDHLFVAARFANLALKTKEIPWKTK